MITLEDLAIGSAFIVMNERHPGVVAAISGDYITLALEAQPGLYDWIDVVPHGVPAREGGGILGADAAALYETAMAAIDAWATRGYEGLFPDDGEEGWRLGYVRRLVPAHDPKAFKNTEEARQWLKEH